MAEKNKGREISGAVETVEKFWKFFIKAEYERALELFAPGAKIYWPCTREVFGDAADFIKVNRDYPGSHKISLKTKNSIDQSFNKYPGRARKKEGIYYEVRTEF